MSETDLVPVVLFCSLLALSRRVVDSIASLFTRFAWFEFHVQDFGVLFFGEDQDPSRPRRSIGEHDQARSKANKEVSSISNSTSNSSFQSKKRGSYMRFTPEQKAEVARYAVESGNKRPC